MGTRKRTTSPDDVLDAATKAQIAAVHGGRHEGAPVPTHQHPFAEGEQVLRDIQWLLARGDGWMRWTSDTDGKTVFLKYKFTSLLWPNHYVFVSGPTWDVAIWMGALVRKCELVDAGQLKPTLDRPFNHM